MLNRTFVLKHKNHWVADDAKSSFLVFCPKSGPQSGFSSLPDFLQPIVRSFTVGGVECLLIWSMCVAWLVFINNTKEETSEGLWENFHFQVLLYKVEKFFGSFIGCPQGLKFIKNSIPLDFWANNLHKITRPPVATNFKFGCPNHFPN